MVLFKKANGKPVNLSIDGIKVAEESDGVLNNNYDQEAEDDSILTELLEALNMDIKQDCYQIAKDEQLLRKSRPRGAEDDVDEDYENQQERYNSNLIPPQSDYKKGITLNSPPRFKRASSVVLKKKVQKTDKEVVENDDEGTLAQKELKNELNQETFTSPVINTDTGITNEKEEDPFLVAARMMLNEDLYQIAKGKQLLPPKLNGAEDNEDCGRNHERNSTLVSPHDEKENTSFESPPRFKRASTLLKVQKIDNKQAEIDDDERILAKKELKNDQNQENFPPGVPMVINTADDPFVAVARMMLND